MALEKVLMRDVTAEINTGTESTPNWGEILGINAIERKTEAEKKDVADNKSGGNKDNRVTARGETWTLKGDRLEDPATGARDPGQEAVEALSEAVGYADSVKQFRFTSPGGVSRTFLATAVVQPLAGGKEEFSTWEAEIEKCGAAS